MLISSLLAGLPRFGKVSFDTDMRGQPSAPTCQRLPRKFSDSTTSELPEKERDDRDDGQHDSNPEQEVERLDESAGDQQNDGDDRNDDQESVHTGSTFRDEYWLATS